MMRACFFASALFAATCAAAVAGEKTYEGKYQTVHGKVVVTFNHSDGFSVLRETASGVALMNQELKQLVTFATGPAKAGDVNLSAKDACEAVTKTLKEAYGDKIEFIESGPAYKLDGDIETASVMMGLTVKSPDGAQEAKMRVWFQFAVRGDQLFMMNGQWVVDGPETQEFTAQARIEQAFGATFKSLKISDAR